MLLNYSGISSAYIYFAQFMILFVYLSKLISRAKISYVYEKPRQLKLKLVKSKLSAPKRILL